MSPEHQQCANVAYLTPTRRANTNREDGKEPRVNLAEPGEEQEEDDPYTDEEDANEEKDLPVRELGVP